jgi:hypothetical protein
MNEITTFGWLVIVNVILWLSSVVLAGKSHTLEKVSQNIAVVATLLSAALVLWWLVG